MSRPTDVLPLSQKRDIITPLLKNLLLNHLLLPIIVLSLIYHLFQK